LVHITHTNSLVFEFAPAAVGSPNEWRSPLSMISEGDPASQLPNSCSGPSLCRTLFQQNARERNPEASVRGWNASAKALNRETFRRDVGDVVEIVDEAVWHCRSVIVGNFAEGHL